MDSERTPSLRLLYAIVAATIVSTAIHYTHNYVEIEEYPRSDLASNDSIQVGILISWPLLTAIGLYGVRLYARGRRAPAHAALLAYSVLGLLTFAHFVDGVPDIPAVFFATIFTDGLAGLALVWFVLRSHAAARGA